LLDTEQLTALSADQIANLTTAQLIVLDETQIAGLTTNQIMSLTTRQIVSLSSIQIPALETADFERLTTSQIGVLTTFLSVGSTTRQRPAVLVLDVLPEALAVTVTVAGCWLRTGDLSQIVSEA
jgi:hypothetical protein